MKTGHFLFKYQNFTPIPFIAAAIIYAQPRQDLMIFGGLLVLAGLLLRLWGKSYVMVDGHDRLIESTVLVTNGPYAFMRNPVYFANIVILTGIVIAFGGLLPHLMWLVIFYVSVQYALIVRYEEDELLKKFGDHYANYALAVPRFYPRLSPFPDRIRKQPVVQAALKSEMRVYIIMFVLMILLLLFHGRMSS